MLASVETISYLCDTVTRGHPAKSTCLQHCINTCLTLHILSVSPNAYGQNRMCGGKATSAINNELHNSQNMKLISLILRDLRKQFFLILCTAVTILALMWSISWAHAHLSGYFIHYTWVALTALTLALWFAIMVCRSLTNIFSLRKKEAGITWCQIAILISIGLWIVGFVIIFDAKSHPRLAAGLGIAGSILTWIFQDTLKGVVAFIHLRINHLLNIDDWIKIPSKNVDGQVVKVTLTTVTIYNWDTTTSSIPTSVLHTDHFINLQNMMKGKTFGRRMFYTFIFDMGWIHILSKEETDKLKNNKKVTNYLPAEQIEEGWSNARLFRMYLFHWLMNHPHVSQQPRLIVRWMEQKETGLPLQMYAFITDSSLVSFELQQSQIIEHVIESLEWFGLQLYQSPSGYDTSNSNIFMTDKPATYRKED